MNKPIVDRSKIADMLRADLGPDEDDDGFGYVENEASAPVVPEAAPVEQAPVAEASPTSDAAPSPQPQYDYSQELKESRAMVSQLIQAQQERERWEREQWQRQQEAQRQTHPQYDPEQYIQRQHLDDYNRQFSQVGEDMRYVVQETRELRAAHMANEFQSALSRFQNNPEYPDLDKYVPQSVRDAALNAVQREIHNGKKFRPGEVNWADLIEREYRIQSYPDLAQERKTRASNEAKRAEVDKKLAEVGGTPRGGAHQQPAPQKDANRALPGEHGFQSRVIAKMRSLGVEF